VTCHKRAGALWRGSHHQLAMQPAVNSTVLGDFSNATFSNNRITSTFFRSASKFMVSELEPTNLAVLQTLEMLKNQLDR
jgi:hypothetical protein